jgi:phthiocerol/phenolphthiocerol synthesis type-I polyketide synthase D
MSASCVEPVAVIGVGCRFPGGVDSAAGLWNLPAEGRSTVGPVPPDRWDALTRQPDRRDRLEDP